MGSKTLVARAWILLGSITTILSIGIAVSWVNNSNLRDTTNHLVDNDYQFQLTVLDLQLNIVQVQQWLTDISATRGLDGLDDGFTEAEKHAKQARSLIAQASAFDKTGSDFYQKLLTTFNNYYQTGKKMAELYVAQGPSAGNPFMETFDQAAAAMADQLNTVLDKASGQTSERVDTIHDISSHATLVNISVAAITMLCLIGGLLYLIYLLKPLEHIRKSIVHLADNDLTFEMPAIKGEHEIAVLASSFTKMRENLSKAIHEINSVASAVTTTTHTMSSVCEQTNDGVSAQNREIEQIATAINQLAETVQDISRNTTYAASSSQQANEAVVTGSRVVEEAIVATRALANEVSNGADVVNQLQSESEKIGNVVNVIQGIAEQTNLLALNAAIEAARAGEQGRGFAVVADEVRNLATKTQESTHEIEKMIERLQSGSTEASSVMTLGREHAEQTVLLVSDAGDSLSSIRESVGQINEMSIQIATAAEQQGSVASEINQNIEGIRLISKQTAEASQQTNTAGHSLNEQASALHHFVNRFNV
ncbi:MAG: methyl-accepting chemotaxis protein [Candidatus Thiodiazotropha sp.]